MRIYTFLSLAGIASWTGGFIVFAGAHVSSALCLFAAGWVFIKAARSYALAEPENTEQV
jgi:hypothetical protein